jgi:hypothetical protein
MISLVAYQTAKAFSGLPNLDMTSRALTATAKLFESAGPALKGIAWLVASIQFTKLVGDPVSNLIDFLGKLSKSIKPMVAQMIGLSASIKDPAAFEAVTNTVVKLISAMGSLAKNLGNAVDSIKPSWFEKLTNSSSLKDNMIALTGFVAQVFGAGVKPLVDSIILFGSKFTPAEIESIKSMGFLSELLGSIADFTRSIVPPDSFFDAAKGGFIDNLARLGKAEGPLGENLTKLRDSIIGVAGSLRDNLPIIMKNMLSLPFPTDSKIEEMAQRANIVSTLLGAVSSVTASLMSIKPEDLEGPNSMGTKFSKTVSQLSDMFSENNLATLKGTFSRISEKLDTNVSADLSMGKVGQIQTAFDMFKQLDETAKAMMIERKEGITSPIVAAVQAMAKEADIINAELANIEASDLELRLKRLGDKLGISTETLSIRGGQVNIQQKITIILEADKLSAALAEHNLVSTQKT